MTPSSCSTAPSLISFHDRRSLVPVMAERLRIRLVAIAGFSLKRRSESFLFGESAVNFVAQQLGQLDAQGLGLAREEIARPCELDRHDGLDAPRTGSEHHHAVGQRHSLVDVV